LTGLDLHSCLFLPVQPLLEPLVVGLRGDRHELPVDLY
jgi:hypothetical protein